HVTAANRVDQQDQSADLVRRHRVRGRGAGGGVDDRDRARERVEAGEHACAQHSLELVRDDVRIRLEGAIVERERAVEYQELVGGQHDLEARYRLFRQKALADADGRIRAAGRGCQ